VLDKLAAIKRRWEEVEQKLSDPKVIGDMKEFKKFNKEYKDLTEVVNAYHDYKNVVDNIDFNKEVLATEKDDEMREMAKADLEELLAKKEEMENAIRQMLIPKDPEDAKHCVIWKKRECVMKWLILMKEQWEATRRLLLK
jgi:peptide chain release factor 1